MSSKRSFIPVSLGVACVWFGIHCGPGTASGKQAVVYFAQFGKWALIAPIIAMGLLAFCVYLSIEFARSTNSESFKDFANKLFHPYEKIFANLFEFTFVATVGMSGGASVYTGAYLFEQFYGIPVAVGMIIIAAVTILFSIYGAEIVRASSSYMSFMILAAMLLLVVLGIRHTGGVSTSLSMSSFDVAPFTKAGWNAILYAGFQSTGVIGAVVAVAVGLKDRKESKKAAVIGLIMNAAFLIVVSVMLFGYADIMGQQLPNYEVITILNMPVLSNVYVLIVFLACVTNTIGFSHALSARYGKYMAKAVPNPKMNKLVICVIMLVYVSCVSFFGLNAIVGTGFTYLGYACLVTLVLPLLIVGPMKLKKLRAKEA